MVIQRLFSGFPGSLPGVALLILRLCVATAIVVDGMRSGLPTGAPHLILLAAAWISAVLILVGGCTPIAAIAGAATEVVGVLAGAPWLLTRILVTAIAVSLALLGPGAWSIDSYRYGRKRLI